jgi:hypothetical protein
MVAREALLDRVSAAEGDTEIKDPATGEVIGRHTFGTAADVRAAVDKAAAASSAGNRGSWHASSRPGPFEIKILIFPNGPWATLIPPAAPAARRP